MRKDRRAVIAFLAFGAVLLAGRGTLIGEALAQSRRAKSSGGARTAKPSDDFSI